jgi:hypothetical protein
VRFGNWITSWWKRGSSREFHFRAVAEWCRWLTAADLEVSVRPMGMGTPFGNVLLVARKKTSLSS